MSNNQQQQQQQSMTQEEVGEYISKLQAGKIEPDSDNPLEIQALTSLRELGKRVAAMTNDKNRAEKEVANAQAQIRNLETRINSVSGEMAAYASLLASAEMKRREEAEQALLDKASDDQAEARREEARKRQVEKKATKGKANGKEPEVKAVPAEPAQPSAN